jgi:hypothetical protein
LCPIKSLRGGYNVQPVPVPDPITPEAKSINKDGGNNQKLILFIRGKDISGARFIKGISQFPNPPIIVGITKKKIITKAWEVTTLL